MRRVSALFFAALVAVTAAAPLRAQDAQNDRTGTRVISNTVEHTAPRPMPAFTDTPPAEENRAAGSPAFARGQNSSDDFDNTTPGAWWIYSGQSVADIDSLTSGSNARLIDIVVDSWSPYSFTITAVQNTGAYHKEWWWYYGLTADQVSAKLTANNARLTSLKAYDIGGGKIRFAVIMIANTGADQRGWWWYFGQTPADIKSKLADNKPARLIALDAYTTGGKTYYTDVMIANSGSEASGWYWYYNMTVDGLAGELNNARIIYLSLEPGGSLDAVLESCANGCAEWWWYVGVDGDYLLNVINQNGARPIALNNYTCGNSTCYDALLINNSNEITTRVGNLIRGGGIQGTEGLYLEQLNGPSPGGLAALEDGVAFEPASTIKVVANLYAMTQVQAGKIALTTPIRHNIDGPESCPSQSDFSGTEPLETALVNMMWHSDNARTLEVTDKFTDAKINAYAQKIGMKNTAINQIIGCAFPPDTLTLDDAATLYAGVANQDPLFLKPEYRGIFYSNMAGRAQYESEGYDWTAVWDNDIPNIINEVAPAGTTAAQKQAYMNEMNVAYKAGNYVLCPQNCSELIYEDIAIAGWFQIPYCSAAGTTYAEYVWGIYFSNEPTSGWDGTFDTLPDENFLTAKSELMREQIAAGMASCKGKSFAVMAWSPADLTFTTTKVGKTTPSKLITITNKQLTKVTGLSISVFGDFTETSTCGSSLASGKTCTISVDFTPTATGERTGAVIVTDSGAGQPQTIQLTGTGS